MCVCVCVCGVVGGSVVIAVAIVTMRKKLLRTFFCLTFVVVASKETKRLWTVLILPFVATFSHTQNL